MNSTLKPILRSLAAVVLSLTLSPYVQAASPRAPSQPSDACAPTCFLYIPITSRPLGVLAATIEFNQALGQASGRYVAGKDGAVVVYLQGAPVAVDPAKQGAVVKRDGNVVAMLAPNGSDQPVSTLVFRCPDQATCGNWQAGNYSFDVTVNGSVKTLDNIALVNRRPMRVLAVPMRVNYGGSVEDVTGNAWQTAGNFMGQVYPVAPQNFTWQLGQAVDTSQFDITTDAGQLGVWQTLRDLQPRQCANDTTGPDCYDKIIGFMPRQIELPGGGRLNGYTYGSPANIVGLFAGTPRTVAHEVGHNFRLGDEYDGLGGQFNCDANPTPPTYVGRNFNAPQQTNYSCVNSTTQPFEESGTGVRVVASTARPFDTRGEGLITSDRGDFMGNYGDVNKAWVSPDSWKQVFDGLAPAATRRAPVSEFRSVEINGFISQNGAVTLDPWFSFTSTEAIAPITNTFTIRAVNAASQTLLSQGLDVNFYAPDTADNATLAEAPIFQVVAFPVGTTAFKIMSDTATLAIVPVSAHAPVVTVTAPTAGITITGNFTITWSASDADGDALTYEVEYNHSGNPDDWIALATGLTVTHWMDDFGTLPGGLNRSRIRVTASDGVNAAEATSGLFNVPAKAPEVFIEDPESGDTFKHASSITLDGYAWDAQDDDIESSAGLTWRSSLVSGTLGTGPLIVTSLPVGQNLISLTAVNSLGLTSVATVTVTVTP